MKTGAVDRLTDASKYTGSHKERFDEGGKGKGISGRKDIVDDSGYVTGYKEKGTFEEKNKPGDEAAGGGDSWSVWRKPKTEWMYDEEIAK